ncbi:FAD/NAD-P-binding domain-containing protein [Russula earlei]|uniref:FAD/NAD-P-binding domain-containing protein n=1 Tax=Russula earlei TaxID=71964 RepID=A0ACC0UID5_9AGAM|nr:FAD/NAD-P-binding domain-containing protein [Russula earlei]
MNKRPLPHPSRTHESAKKATLLIRFVVIGGGAAGLACAVALRRVGHRVIVLEKGPDFVGPSKHRGIRMPPNMTKIFNYWGMRDKVGEIGVVTERVVMSRLETAYLLGIHCWEREMLLEAGGEFIALYHSQLRLMLLETALELGAETRINAEVVEIAEDCRSIRLACGEVLEADVIVGADGSRGMCRRLVIPQDPPKGTGIMLFNSIIPADRIHADPELRTLVQQEQVSQWAWFGHDRASVCFPVGPSKDLAWYFFVRDQGAKEGWDDVLTPEQFAPYVRGSEPRLQKLARLARPALTRMMVRDFPEDWVHDTGRLVLVGSAAHPFPPGIIYGPSMSLEDASVLAKLFSHLRDEEQIPSFLYAFQNLREGRCMKNRLLDVSNIQFMMEPEGEGTARRDMMMRAKHDQDSNVAQWDHNRELFGYDAEDEADNWWVQWGLLQERAKASQWEDDKHLGLFSLDVDVRLS